MLDMNKIIIEKYDTKSIIEVANEIPSAKRLDNSNNIPISFLDEYSGGKLKTIALQNIEILYVDKLFFPDYHEVILTSSKTVDGSILDFTIILNDQTDWAIKDKENTTNITSGAFFTSSFSEQKIKLKPNQELSFVTFYVDFNTYKDYFEDKDVQDMSKGSNFIYSNPKLPPNFLSTLNKLIENIEKQPIKLLRVSSLVWALLDIFLQSKNFSSIDLKDKNLWQIIDQARKIIEANFQSHPNIESLCKEVGTNKTTLQKGFKHFFGLPPLQYSINIRLEKGYELLRQGNLSVNEISNAVGYNNVSHFIRLFKRKYGKTPGHLSID